MKQARGILIIGSIIFGGIGLWCLIAPRAALHDLGIELTTADAAADVRAVYGGLDLGVAVFLAWCAAARHRIYTGAVAMTICLAGITLSRALGLLAEGPHMNLSYYLLAFEGLGVLAGVAALRLAGKAGRAPSPAP